MESNVAPAPNLFAHAHKPPVTKLISQSTYQENTGLTAGARLLDVRHDYATSIHDREHTVHWPNCERAHPLTCN